MRIDGQHSAQVFGEHAAHAPHQVQHLAPLFRVAHAARRGAPLLVTERALAHELLALRGRFDPAQHEVVPAVRGQLRGELGGIGFGLEGEPEPLAVLERDVFPAQIPPADPPHRDLRAPGRHERRLEAPALVGQYRDAVRGLAALERHERADHGLARRSEHRAAHALCRTGSDGDRCHR